MIDKADDDACDENHGEGADDDANDDEVSRGATRAIRGAQSRGGRLARQVERSHGHALGEVGGVG